MAFRSLQARTVVYRVENPSRSRPSQTVKKDLLGLEKNSLNYIKILIRPIGYNRPSPHIMASKSISGEPHVHHTMYGRRLFEKEEIIQDRFCCIHTKTGFARRIKFLRVLDCRIFNGYVQMELIQCVYLRFVWLQRTAVLMLR